MFGKSNPSTVNKEKRISVVHFFASNNNSACSERLTDSPLCIHILSD